MLQNTPLIDLALLAFISRETLNLRPSEWDATQEFFQASDNGDLIDLSIRVPVWKPLTHLSRLEWQKKRDELLRLEERGFQFILSSEFPEHSRLHHLPDPPRCLVVMGNRETLFTKTGLAIVGSRNARLELLQWMDRELSTLLKSNSNILVVSGGARGVDQQAHICAIRNQRPTLVWLPSGLLNIYPSNLCHWMASIMEVGGAFASEYHPSSPMRKWYFHQRNRLIVGMSQACWIPQCQTKSGSWMSACLAADAGVPLYVNPAYPWDTHFSGNMKLLSEGAYCLNSYQILADHFCNMSTTPR